QGARGWRLAADESADPLGPDGGGGVPGLVVGDHGAPFGLLLVVHLAAGLPGVGLVVVPAGLVLVGLVAVPGDSSGVPAIDDADVSGTLGVVAGLDARPLVGAVGGVGER